MGKEAIVNRLGRWQASASEGYIRTTRIIVEEFQREFASLVRRSEGHKDFMDEAGLLHSLAEFCKEKGDDAQAIARMIGVLRHFGTGSEEPPAVEASLSDGSSAGSDAGFTPVGDLGEDPDVVFSEGSLPELAGYVVSRTAKRGVRCLHHLARCWRVPGTDYKDFTLHGDVRPPAEAYDRVCKDCWPEEVSQALETPGSVASSDEEAETSTSGEDVTASHGS